MPSGHVGPLALKWWCRRRPSQRRQLTGHRTVGSIGALGTEPPDMALDGCHESYIYRNLVTAATCTDSLAFLLYLLYLNNLLPLPLCSLLDQASMRALVTLDDCLSDGQAR